MLSIVKYSVLLIGHF